MDAPAAEDGRDVPYAQMTPCVVSELAAMVYASLTLVPVRLLSAGSTVATRGGDESTVGITSPGAVRCESVILPSLLGHMMTIGLFVMD